VNILQEALEETLLKALQDGQIENSQLGAVVKEATAAAIPEMANLLLGTLKRSAPRMLREYRGLDRGFRRRNLKRWRGAINLLEMMWVISMEIGPEFTQDVDGTPYEHKIDALVQLHARALLVTREVICLLEGGYPDGALSRWRSLHEIAVTALFLAQHDDEVSERYLESFHFSALRSAEQLNKHAERANLEPYEPAEIEAMQSRCDELAARFGEEMRNRNDYGWAASVLHEPNFSKIEAAVQLDHWRPRYRWASQHTHSGHRPRGALLGLAENNGDEPFLVGASNSGFTDPLHMTAISLLIVTQAMLLTRTKLDYLVVVKIIEMLADEIGPLAQQLEAKTLEAARRAKRGTLLDRLRDFVSINRSQRGHHKSADAA
jgi:hypothetical protein